MRTVLFVCTGNTCRSPMAEAIARHALASDAALSAIGDDIFVASAGISALDGMPTTRETVDALSAGGVDFEGRSKRLSAAMIRKAAFIVCMTEAHRQAARQLVEDSPEDAAKIELLDPRGDIDDPIGLGREAYDGLLQRLRTLVPARLMELLGGKHPAPARGRS